MAMENYVLFLLYGNVGFYFSEQKQNAQSQRQHVLRQRGWLPSIIENVVGCGVVDA